MTDRQSVPAAPKEIGEAVEAMRPMVPAKDFEPSRRFYEEPGFRPRVLADGFVEMHQDQGAAGGKLGNGRRHD